jgi:hypothetical protein
VTLPDLSTVGGFDVAWGPSGDAGIDWTVEALAGTLGGPNGLQPVADGQTIYFAARTATLGGDAQVFGRRAAPRTSTIKLLSRNVLAIARQRD